MASCDEMSLPRQYILLFDPSGRSEQRKRSVHGTAARFPTIQQNQDLTYSDSQVVNRPRWYIPTYRYLLWSYHQLIHLSLETVAGVFSELSLASSYSLECAHWDVIAPSYPFHHAHTHPLHPPSQLISA